MIALLLPGLMVVAALQGGQRPGADSARIVRNARNAQRDFERFRRARLPTGDVYSGTCDVRVGRYCYWRGDDDDEVETPPSEAKSIIARRDQLIQLLGRGAAALPRDAWIAGQRVRYLVDAGRFDDALTASRVDCRAPASWCSALAGYTAHAAGKFALADSLYEMALDAMPRAERCDWLDVGDELNDELHDRYAPLDCVTRERFARRAFRLGAPLYMISATDLLTEHLARRTFARIVEHSATPEGDSWGDDERELGDRYGWPKWFTRGQPRIDIDELTPPIVGHDAGQPYFFLPSIGTFEHPGRAATSDWQLSDPRARSGYAPSYARSIHALPHQIALFRRGDSTLAVGAWDAGRDTTLLGRTLVAGLALAGDSGTLAVTRDSTAHATGRLTTIGLLDSGLVSLELLAATDRRAARARIGAPPRDTGRVALSNLLLFAQGASTDDDDAASEPDLAIVVDSALTSERVPQSRGVGVYWETYGLRTAEPVQYRLSVEPVDVGVMRRLAERLRFSDPTSGFRIEWRDVPRTVNGVATRSTRLDLSRLRHGRYRVQLEVTGAGNATAFSASTFEVP
jgi:hypothetical protein